jgi:hypothetical protein
VQSRTGFRDRQWWPECWTLPAAWLDPQSRLGYNNDWSLLFANGLQTIGWQQWPAPSLSYPRQLHGHFWGPRLLKSCMVPRFHRFNQKKKGELEKGPRHFRTAPRYVSVRRYLQHVTPRRQTGSPDSSFTESGLCSREVSLCS